MMLGVYVREVAKQHFFVKRRLSYFLQTRFQWKEVFQWKNSKIISKKKKVQQRNKT